MRYVTLCNTVLWFVIVYIIIFIIYFAVVFIVRFESFSSPRSVCKALLAFALTIPSNEYTTTNTNGSSSNKYPIDVSTSSKVYITQVNYLLYIVLIIYLFINVTKYMLYSTLTMYIVM